MLEARAAEAREALLGATRAEAGAVAAKEAARAASEAAEAANRILLEQLGAAAERQASLTGRTEALEARLAEEAARGIARVARRVGGRRVDASLQVDPPFRAAVEGALGEAGRAYLVGRGDVSSLAAERGMVLVAERLDETAPRSRTGDRSRTVAERAAALGGGVLADAVRRDDLGAARRLLGRVVWVPDLAAVLEIQADLPEGWLAVTRDGMATATPIAVAFGRPDAVLERRAELERLIAERDLEAEALGVLRRSVEAKAREAEAARQRSREARVAEGEAASRRHAAAEAERVAVRELEAALREAAWQEAQSARLEAEAARARDALTALATEADGRRRSEEHLAGGDVETAAGAWETRVAELRARRDRLAAQVADVDRARRGAEAQRARAEAAVAMGEERIARADRELAALAVRETAARTDREALDVGLATAADLEARTRAALAELQAADAEDRGRLAAAEAEASAARERLRATDARVRATDVAELETRLALDAIRESVLVELAGLGDLGARRLAEAAGIADIAADTTSKEGGDAGDVGAPSGLEASDDADDAARLEHLLDVVGPLWAAEEPDAEAPTPGRLAGLRRRYHELGAANPYAVDEYAALRTRLETLDAQAADLRAAITRTRTLITELSDLIAEQFRATFRALETAFDRSFQRLFGGGFAKLSLTDPGDLSATGIEIVARPPGKKSQNLSMLSGGERALTAVALLFAMLEVRPVPFCVLDEVDAALDEANVGRFIEALRDLAERTQCIVITHNRGTIEAADALYGVTVGDDSVSRVISLRLEEAQAIADRARRSDRLATG